MFPVVSLPTYNYQKILFGYDAMVAEIIASRLLQKNTAIFRCVLLFVDLNHSFLFVNFQHQKVYILARVPAK